MQLSEEQVITGKAKTPRLIDWLVEIWELSVRITHDFVQEKDIAFYKPSVWEFCESMLFVHPDYRGSDVF